MENPTLNTLEEKIEVAVHKMNSLKKQLEEVQAKNMQLHTETLALKNRQKDWEQKLSILVKKLECFENEYVNEEESIEELEAV